MFGDNLYRLSSFFYHFIWKYQFFYLSLYYQSKQLKNNKKGKLAYLWTVISIVVYLIGFGLVATAWEENIGVGILALLLALTTTPFAHRKAIDLAREQRRINGKGLLALIVASVLPLIVLAGGFFFFVFGGMYTFK